MGLFQDVFEGFVTGMAIAATDNLRHGHSPQGTAQLERLCRQVGWDVDEREADTVILHFTDPVVRIRKLIISGGDTGKVALFSVCSAAVIPGRQVQPNLLAHLLVRNGELTTGAWQVIALDSGNIGFAVKYYALTGGLDAGTFKYISESLVREAGAFDGKMHTAGLL